MTGTATYMRPSAISPQIANFLSTDIWTFRNTSIGRLVQIKSVTMAKAGGQWASVEYVKTEKRPTYRLGDIQCTDTP